MSRDIVRNIGKLEYNNNVDVSKIKNVILIDKSVSNYKDFITNSNEMTFSIVYSRMSKSEELLLLLKDKFTSIQRIGMVCHGSSNPNIFLDNKLLFTNDDLTSSVYSMNCSNIINIIKTYSVVNIDFLGCNTLKYDNWNKFYKLLKDNTNVIVGASNNNTGNILYGGDWIMESTSQDIMGVYFTSGMSNYSKLLGIIFFVANNEGVDIYYNVIDNTNTVEVSSNYYKYSGTIIIPSSVINDSITYSVVRIGMNAFFNCTELVSVTIPNSVTSINYIAFYLCGITSITIPDSVTSIDSRAFDSCESLVSVKLPNNINFTYINDDTFCGCTVLNSITIPDSVTYIDSNVFASCTSLTSVKLPNNINFTYINDTTFYECTALTSITIPDSVTYIGEDSFFDCSSLVSLTMPTIEIQSNTFDGCHFQTIILTGEFPNINDYPNLYDALLDSLYTTVYYYSDNLSWTTADEFGDMPSLGTTVIQPIVTYSPPPPSSGSIPLVFFNQNGLSTNNKVGQSNPTNIGNLVKLNGKNLFVIQKGSPNELILIRRKL